MKSIMMYEADDGSRWETPDKALERDALILRCAAIEARIGLRPVSRTSDFANGGGYVQQPKGARDRLYEELKKLGANRDSDGPIGKLLYRAWHIDDRDREWGQPYFATHPEKGTDREWQE